MTVLDVELAASKLLARASRANSAARVAADNCNLRDQSGRCSLISHDQSERVERVRRLLESESAAVKQTDHRCAGLLGKGIYPRNFLRVHLADGSIQNWNVLAVDVDEAAVNRAISGDYTIGRSLSGREVEICGACCYKAADFDKAVCIKQSGGPTACCA